MAVPGKHGRIVKGCIKIIFSIVVFRTYLQLKDFRQLSSSTDLQTKTETVDDGALATHFNEGQNNGRFTLRHLLEAEDDNCTTRGIESFPRLFTNEQRLHGAIIINFLVAFYMCGMIGYNCDVYFIPALEVLCEELEIKPDVAGATFMAIGSSAPEFFSAVIGTFISEDDTALSAIVGSAAFNVFIIISCCCFFVKKEVPLTGWPLFRDGVCYILSILLLVLFIYDSKVQWWEGLIMVLAYFLYIVLMHYNTYFQNKAANWLHPKRIEVDKTPLIGQNHIENSYGSTSYNKEHESVTTKDFAETGDVIHENGVAKQIDAKLANDQNGFVRSDRSDPMDGTISEYKSLEVIPNVFKPPEHIAYKIIWFLGFPTIVLMFLTIPDVKRPRWRKWYYLSFVMSLLWLMGTSYILYWMIVVMGYTFNIPDTVMGITLLAAGTSVPDLLSSVIVARHGFGDMALSNVIGSNIFDVLMCLGLLWFLRAAFIAPVNIATDGLTFTSITLMFTVLFVVIAIHLNGWRLNMKLGIICLTVYIIFITFAVLRELGVLGNTLPPVYCPVSD